MKSVIILESDHLAAVAMDMLNPNEMELIGIGNSYSDEWNVLDDEGNITDDFEGIAIMPIDLAVALQSDVIVLAAPTKEKCDGLRYMAIRAGYMNDIIFMSDLTTQFSIQSASLRRMAYRLNTLNIEGNIAELGCFNGNMSWQLNALFKDRKLYLYDTFVGFDERDIEIEEKNHYSDAKLGQYAPKNPDAIMERLPYKDNVIIKKGWFPMSAQNEEDEKFTFVFMDACLYQPTYKGLEFFFPRMSRGGMILINHYDSPIYQGVEAAIKDLEAKYGVFLIVPLGDFQGSMMIVHP